MGWWELKREYLLARTVWQHSPLAANGTILQSLWLCADTTAIAIRSIAVLCFVLEAIGVIHEITPCLNRQLTSEPETNQTQAGHTQKTTLRSLSLPYQDKSKKATSLSDCDPNVYYSNLSTNATTVITYFSHFAIIGVKMGDIVPKKSK